MVQDGPPSPKTSHPRPGCSCHDNAVTNHMRDPDNSSSSSSIPNLLLTCAQNDRGGGVSLNYVFAIYSTARLPPTWTASILHATTSGDEIYMTRLQTLADKISDSLPIYTSWDDVRFSPSSDEGHQIQSLNIPSHSSSSSSATTSDSGSIARQIGRQKPHFLLNAALHERHCIIGHGSLIETLLVVLRRPWCVLEICVSNLRDTDVLESILVFARTAQELDYSGYSTAVFLLKYEIRARKHRCQAITLRTEYFGSDVSEPKRRSVGAHSHSYGTEANLFKHSSSRQVYEMCNTVFLPSLKSFNSFWIRLICVSAIEMGVSLTSVISRLCDKKQQSLHKQRASFVPAGAGTGRRQSEVETSSFRRSESKDEHAYNKGVGEEDVVEKMLEVYTDVLRRAGDYI